MRRIVCEANPGKTAPIRIALLPGAYQNPEEFEYAGFVAAVRARDLAIDLEFIAIDFAHVLDRSGLAALRNEFILPARLSGCREIWLGGASLGAYIAMVYADQRPGDVDGLCLFAPYLGSHIVTSEITEAGGVRAWQPRSIAADDEERRVWALIRRLPSERVRVHLGVGGQDRFGHGHRLFADALPQGASDIVTGGHDWGTWLRLWELFLDRIAKPPAAHAPAAGPLLTSDL